MDMPPGLEKHIDLTAQIIAACYEVHNNLGAGLEERFYRDALLHELSLNGISAEKERVFGVRYKGIHLGGHRVDLIVENKVVVELKAVSGRLLDIHFAQTLSELNVSGLSVALLVNFGGKSVQVRRFEKRTGDKPPDGKISKSPNPGAQS
jgi:GxxExxY protein